jgi:cytochrome oxidase assembly protein ShyY1
MRWILALVLMTLVAASALGGWQIQRLTERLEIVEAERDVFSDALADLEQRAGPPP